MHFCSRGICSKPNKIHSKSKQYSKMLHIENIIKYIKLNVLRTLALKITVYWHVTPCSLQTFTDIFEDVLNMEATPCSKTSVHFYQTIWRHVIDDKFSRLYMLCIKRVWVQLDRPIYELHSVPWYTFLVLVLDLSITFHIIRSNIFRNEIFSWTEFTKNIKLTYLKLICLGN